MQPDFIDSSADLDAVIERLAQADFIALDTEFVRVRTYFPVLCLIQIGDGERAMCVDTLAFDDLGGLMRAVAAHGDGLTLHAGRQDFEALYQKTGILPDGVWDTQIAAAMLGFGEQVSYAKLVEDLLGIALDKSQTRTNWARRPLSDKQLQYAADDVVHLRGVRDHLGRALEDKDRTAWLAEDCQALLDAALYEPDFESAWRRCKLRRRLSPEQRGAWKALCTLRERKAAETDRPRRWVLEDAALEELATLAPSDERAINRLLGSGRIRRRIDAAAVKDALTDPEPAHDQRGSRPDPQMQKTIDTFVQEVRATAEKLNISASLLATRKEVEALVRGKRSGALVSGWRREVIGEALLELLT